MIVRRLRNLSRRRKGRWRGVTKGPLNLVRR